MKWLTYNKNKELHRLFLFLDVQKQNVIKDVGVVLLILNKMQLDFLLQNLPYI